MKPTKEIIEKAARRGALLQNVQLIMWEFVKKRESDESVNWIEYAGKIVDVVEGKDTPEGKLISTYKDKLWDKNLELDPDDDTPKETWHKEFSKIMLDWIQSQWNIESSHQKGEPYTRMKFEAEASKVERRLEFFISKELAQAKADMIERVEGLSKFEESDNMHCSKCDRYVRMRESHHSEDGYSECCGKKLKRVQEKVRMYCEYNDALDDALATLREDYKLKKEV
jgi:hypothetical protein